MARVELKDLTKIYGTNTVVDHINLTVEEGTLISILGPSGCGKTTTLRMIAGFEEVNDGDIFFDGDSVKKIPVNKREIGMVFQSYALFPHMTVFDNVAYGLQQRNVKGAELKQRVEDALKMVHMEDYAKRKPRQLSGGQQQRVALARALVIRPKVLLLDECLSALDKKLRVEMQVELRKILEECHVTTFFVTHDQEEAMTLSDSIVVMHSGIIEQTGTPHEVYEYPRNRFVASFLGKANFFGGKVLEAGEDYAVIEMKEGTWKIPARGAKVGQTLTYAVRPEKIDLVEEAEAAMVGEVAAVTYSGNAITYRVICQGLEVIIEMRTNTSQKTLEKGTMVGFTWEPEEAILLED